MGKFYNKIIDTIPIDTGGLIRVGILDLINGYGSKDIINTLDTLGELGTDARDLRNLANSWNSTEPIEIESGTLFRIAWFYFKKMNISRKIIPIRTLIDRVKKMNLDSDIINWSLSELGTLEGGTSQWQTAAILLGNTEKLEESPFYLRKTYRLLEDWKKSRKLGKCWEVPRDPTLITQSRDYIYYLQTGRVLTISDRLGDCDLYPFLRVFGAVERRWAENNWPQLFHHESNRFEFTDLALQQYKLGKIIDSNDHRIVEALAMFIQYESIKYENSTLPVEKIKQRFSNPSCVSKKWPRFWEALEYFPQAAREKSF